MLSSRALLYAVAVVFFALFTGCSRSSLQDELGLSNSTSCTTNADCPSGTSCDPNLGLCVIEDAGTDAQGCTANVASDPNNCGACGNVCPSGDSCVGGACLLPNQSCASNGCEFSETCCASGCVDTVSDSNNCGGCGVTCPSGESCSNGACDAVPPPPPSCVGCLTGTCCENACTDTTSDLNNCGGCGLACPSWAIACVNAQCCTAQTCGPPICNCTGAQTCCTTGCADTSSDPNNCGGCGLVCASGESCANSMCSTSCAGGPACTGGASCCATGCSNVLTDPSNCGVCGVACSAGKSCVAGKCESPCGGSGGTQCSAGQTCCPTGCASTQTDPANCGACNVQCGSTATCIDGSCVASEGAFDPIVNPTYLAPGVHTYTSINVPAGVTVYVAGAGPLSGTLDLQATGPIEIDGTIDVSGGPGTQNTITSQSTQSGRAGGGGFTGEPYETAALSAACQFVGGNPGSLGFAVSGSPGTCPVGSSTICDTIDSPTSQLFAAPAGEYGGGAGVFTGYRAYGSGGGGAAGGAPGALGAAYPGEADCSGASGGGGASNGQGGAGGSASYDGTGGVLGQTQCVGIDSDVPAAYVGGGGGGSIGETAAADLAVATTFRTGSAGGGGSADYLNRPVFGGTSGGGGGGGALKLQTTASIVVTGQLLANGGIGGDSVIGTPAPNCDPQPGAAGGGGSGGVIYLSAPSITVSGAATLSAVGGAGGAQSEFATGGAGGKGGLGRIRLSVGLSSCSLMGAFDPPLASQCSATPGGTTGATYVGVYPN